MPGSGRENVAIGEVSVIPQPWKAGTPSSSSIARISSRLGVEPPSTRARRLRRSAPVRRDVRDEVDRQGGDHPEVGGALALDDRRDVGDARCGPGRIWSAPTMSAASGTPQAFAWNIGHEVDARGRGG